MPSTPDDVALVRLRIADTGSDPLLSDEQIALLLSTHGGSAWRASADALRTIAASEALVGKKIRTQELSTDGPAVARELRLLADDYDRKADEQDTSEAGSLHLVPFGGRRHAEGVERRWDGGGW